MRTITIIASVLWLAGTATAQNDGDIQRYTNMLPVGTARFASMGGAFSALGGDISAIHVNPAGIGVFRFSELSITPSVESNIINTSLTGVSTSGVHTGFNIASAGLVLASEINDPYWRSVNVGFSINRMNTFNDHLITQGTIPLDRSLMQSFVNEANGSTLGQLSDFGAGLAWDTNVINSVSDDPNNTTYVGIVNEGEMNQRLESRRTGRMTDFAITVGGNYDDRLYIGAAMGIVSSIYEVRTEIAESPTLPLSTELVRYRYNENLNVEGFGVNFSLGFIYRMESGLRLGGSIQTPTTLRLRDVYSTNMNSFFRDPDETFTSPLTPLDDLLEYRIRTPWRYSAGIAGVVNSKFILSAQYEFVNFPGGRFQAANRRSGGITASMNTANDVMSLQYRSQHILRGGVEFRMNKSLSARGGAAYFPNVIPDNAERLNGSPNRLQLGGGLGYRKAAWNVDLSYTFARVYEPFNATNVGFDQELRNTFGVVSITLGFRL